jgi:hypothetical protein
MVASIKNISARGVTIGQAPTPIFFKDLYSGTSTLTLHTPDIFPSGMYYDRDGADFNGYVTGGNLVCSDSSPSAYATGSFGDALDSPMANTNTYLTEWNWNSGTVNGNGYYSTYLIIRTVAGNHGIVIGSGSGSDVSLTPLGGTTVNDITLTDNTNYSGSLNISATSITINFLGVNQTFANPNSGDTFNNRRPYGLYLLLSYSTKYSDITMTMI